MAPLRLAFRTCCPRPHHHLQPRPTTASLHRTFFAIASLRIKEDAQRTPEQLEQEKQDSLEKQEKGEGHWKEGLASHGETNIKADREKVDDHGEHIADLQKETAEKAEKGKM